MNLEKAIDFATCARHEGDVKTILFQAKQAARILAKELADTQERLKNFANDVLAIQRDVLPIHYPLSIDLLCKDATRILETLKG